MTANSKDRELPTHAKPLAMQRLFCGVAGVEGVALSRQFNILIQGEGPNRAFETQI